MRIKEEEVKIYLKLVDKGGDGGVYNTTTADVSSQKGRSHVSGDF